MPTGFPITSSFAKKILTDLSKARQISCAVSVTESACPGSTTKVDECDLTIETFVAVHVNQAIRTTSHGCGTSRLNFSWKRAPLFHVSAPSETTG